MLQCRINTTYGQSGMYGMVAVVYIEQKLNRDKSTVLNLTEVTVKSFSFGAKDRLMEENHNNSVNRDLS